MDKNKAMKLALDALLIWEEMHPKTTASAIRSPAIQALQEALEQPECNQHPDAPHGFNRESSHSLGRYVCDCEGWEPEEQEPVAYITGEYKGYFTIEQTNKSFVLTQGMNLYIAPPKRKWQGLTDEEIGEVGIGHVEGEHMLPYSFARAIEAKLKEKNHD